MRAAIIQFEPGVDRATNIQEAGALIAQAVRADAPDLVSLPEMWSCLGGNRTIKLAQSEALPPGCAPGPAYSFLQETARRHGITVHGGSIGERDGDRLFNTSLVFGPDGAELARYRKIHLFDVTTPNGQGYRESALFGAGHDIRVAAVPGGAVLGLSICYDLRFPELYLALRRAGADVLMIPSAFTEQTGRDHWEVLVRARAIETQSWVIAAATTGAHRDGAGEMRRTWGHSMIVDPWGHVQAALGAETGFVTAEIGSAIVERVRASMPVLQHRVLA